MGEVKERERVVVPQNVEALRKVVKAQKVGFQTV